ncbi:MAG TPA: hypothetical protein VMD25_12695 [Acidobacteriaceae bacterium]|nr:hypothetical protein [Acidobacteriaceae bacterium]
MDQKQLQIARAAVWRQTANPVLTLDDAAAWIEETGLCLFLPRHAQLPAPAPSLVEACAGEARAVFAAPAIDAAMELAARLVADGRAVPLNLMGNFSEQPDYLSSPETFRWIAAVRGDRNWKAAPGGRTAPLVARTWEALSTGEKTVAEIQELLGRELTEGAILRALVELWTTLRAFPRYEPGQPTRWALAKDRFPSQLGAAAGTAQATGLSALVSLYLGSAVAATAEETEIFLSPLTARSRVREVLHGMMAARQLGTMALGVNTLLFVEGSLPEMAPEPEMEQAGAVEEPRRAPRAVERPHDNRRETRGAGPARDRRGKPHGGERRERPGFGRGKKPPFRPGQKREFGPARGKPWEKRRPGEFAAGEGRGQPERGSQREGGWKEQKPRQESGAGENRPFAREGRPPADRGKRFEGRPSGDRGKRLENRPPREKREGFQGRPQSRKPWEKRGPREARKFGERPSGKKPFGAKESVPKPFGEKSSGKKPFGEKKFGPKKFGKPGFGPKKFGSEKFGPKKFGSEKFGPKKFGPKKFGKPGFGAKKFGPRREFGGRAEAGSENRGPKEERPPFRGRAQSSGKPFRQGPPKSQSRPDRKAGRFGKPQGKSFRKPGAPAGRKPRKAGEGKEEA